MHVRQLVVSAASLMLPPNQWLTTLTPSLLLRLQLLAHAMASWPLFLQAEAADAGLQGLAGAVLSLLLPLTARASVPPHCAEVAAAAAAAAAAAGLLPCHACGLDKADCGRCCGPGRVCCWWSCSG